MKIKGIKGGQTIELLGQINYIPDGAEIIVDVLVSPNQIVETEQALSNEEKLSKLNQDEVPKPDFEFSQARERSLTSFGKLSICFRWEPSYHH
ncbi:hypothetical protein NIES4101_54260 [Calothrix sp. NIES-4101]|nr:hypothetical protein NIES4101_54260 [Calothrix sp. NIES-4101]